jgi:hypothetical protein
MLALSYDEAFSSPKLGLMLRGASKDVEAWIDMLKAIWQFEGT